MLLKDLHLIEVGVKADRRIVSRDRRAREGFSALAAHASILKRVLWVDILDDGCHDWLASGAPSSARYVL